MQETYLVLVGHGHQFYVNTILGSICGGILIPARFYRICRPGQSYARIVVIKGLVLACYKVYSYTGREKIF